MVCGDGAHIHAHTRTHARTHTHIHKHMRVSTHAHMHKHTHTHTHARARARPHIVRTSRHLVLSSLFSTVVQNFPTRSKQSMWIWTWNSGHGFGLGQWHRLWISECTLLFHERNENLQSVEGRLFLSTALHNLWSWWVTNHSYNYSIFTLTREIRKGLGDRNLSTLIRIVK